ncbi:MAG: hypothetical protein BGO49_11120 [Planctomycetales bacterium 71-10]|nr:MAG: hypothetical protein BGO49_11120 [Planctomycetales bacterium 71-10]
MPIDPEDLPEGIVEIVDVKSKGGWSLDGGRTYSIELQVQTDDLDVGPKAVIDALHLWEANTYRWPFVEAAKESDPRSFLQSVEADEVGLGQDGAVWKVTLAFAPRDPSKDDRGPIDEDGSRDPFAARPTVSAHSESEEVAVTHDRDGEPILNSAGDPFDPPLAISKPCLVIEVSRMERYFLLDRVEDLESHVNDAEWMGWPAGSVLCKSIKPRQVWLEDVNGYGWEVEYEFAFKRPLIADDGGDDVTVYPGWAVQVLDCGMRQKVSGAWKDIQVDNKPVSTPVPLKSDGTVASPTDDPHYLTFNLYPPADFSVLDFPADLFSAGTPETP